MNDRKIPQENLEHFRNVHKSKRGFNPLVWPKTKSEYEEMMRDLTATVTPDEAQELAEYLVDRRRFERDEEGHDLD